MNSEDKELLLLDSLNTSRETEASAEGCENYFVPSANETELTDQEAKQEVIHYDTRL